MEYLVATTRARIEGTHNSWGVGAEGSECEVDLRVQGDPAEGYFLIQSPDGFFTADDWFETREDALRCAARDYGIARDEWSVGSDADGQS